MKISKLFHWLYAFLMLMPVFAVVAACITTFWNETIDMPTQEVIEVPSYETNEVNSVDDLVVGRLYDFTISTNYTTSQINYFNASKIYNLNNNGNKVNLDAENTADNSISFIEVANYFRIVSNNLAINVTINGKAEMSNNICQFVYNGYFNPDYISSVSEATWMPQGSYIIEDTESKELNVFYYAIDELQENVLFSWANNSFLYTPFHYIGSLFNVDNDSVVYTLLSYWSSISIIYLVFDLVMYVPLLAHRWIDKGMIE